MSHRLFFDIETEADMEAVDKLPEPLPDARLKDPKKIQASIEKKKGDLVSKAAINPATAKIVAIGYQVGVDGEVKAVVNKDGEVDLLDHFWELYADARGKCVGYNILGFDLPVILRRSLVHGIMPTDPPVVLAKYRDYPITDLMHILSNWSNQQWESLKQVVKMLDIPVDFSEEESGEFVQYMTVEQIERYVTKDVEAIVHLYKKMNHIYFGHA